jgi:hypothetical protein
MEKVEDQELTSLMETVRQMVACTSRDRAMKFEVKRGVLGKVFGKITMNMVKALLPTFIYFLPFILIFILFYSSNLMPNSPMSVMFCRCNDFEVHTKEYICFLFFHHMLNCFLWFLDKTLSLVFVHSHTRKYMRT